VLERLLETISFDASDRSGASLEIDADYVDRNLGELAKDQDLARYIL
jgi:ATP-dependent HslUV protease ATP-binding subunit HslU